MNLKTHLSYSLSALLLFALNSSCESDLSGKDPLPEDGGKTTAIKITENKTMATEKNSSSSEGSVHAETATFAGGCFWCLEAVFQQLDGVLQVTSGYMGGRVPKPTYEQVCSGDTGHAEVVQLKFDPTKTTYEKLLDAFWKLHDPTTLNRQGKDAGTQYRSAIFYHNDSQRPLAEASKKKQDASGAFKRPMVTEITKAGEFYPAEDYHQNYYRQNREQPYCRFIIAPKLDKLGLEK